MNVKLKSQISNCIVFENVADLFECKNFLALVDCFYEVYRRVVRVVIPLKLRVNIALHCISMSGKVNISQP